MNRANEPARRVKTTITSLAGVLFSIAMCLMLPSSIRADTVNINSINANNSPFFVDISTTNLLAQYGITLANVTPGTTVAVACGECGGNSVVPSSPPNVLTQFGNDNGMSYTLQFSAPLSGLSFNLAGNSKSGGSGTVVAAWSATAFDASGNVVSSVGDPSLFGTFSSFAPQPFILTGPGIASVTFFTQCFNFCGTLLNIADLSAPEIKLKNTTCQVNVTLRASGASMFAQFTPPSGISLIAAANACGFDGFDWQQSITNWPAPSPSSLRPVNPSLIPQNILPDGEFVAPPAVNDPPPGSWTYLPSGGSDLFSDPYPFYYRSANAISAEEFPAGQTPETACVLFPSIFSSCSVFLVSSNGKTLSFHDAPNDPCLPGGNIIKQELLLCGTGAPPGSFLGFTTNLVGILPGGLASPPLFQWTWKSNFNGTSGGAVRVSSNQPVDPGSGTGGVTITGINGVPQTPLTITCIATPNILWPPDGKLISVTISGSVTAGTSPLASNTTSFSVADSEQQIQSSGSITLASDGSYSFAVSLPAAREGSDKNGRQYGISVQSGDQTGNQASCSSVVSVPHDQRH